MIKRYSQFIKENIQAEEEHNVSDEDMETIRRGDEEGNDELFGDEETIEGDLPFKEETEEENDGSMEDQMEEEGGEYIGQKMMQELSDKLDCPVEADGSINCHGKKINFYSETEMFHVDKKKFSTVEEVVDYIENPGMENAGLETDEEEIRQSQKEREDNTALLANKGEFADEESQEEMEREMEEEYESKSYKKTRKFRRSLKK
jgi:hypothetical protein